MGKGLLNLQRGEGGEGGREEGILLTGEDRLQSVYRVNVNIILS